MVTPKQYAELTGAKYTTVMRWLQNDLIKGAKKHPLPSGGHYYLVPADAEAPELRPGPNPKSKDEKKQKDQ